MSKLGLAAVAALLVLGIAASTASAQAPAVIEAVDAPGPAFAPSEVTVATGTTVRWEFDQATTQHTVTSTGTNWEPPLDETRNPGGAAVERTFNTAGTYTYICRIHGGMTGTVTVEGATAPRFDVLVFSRTTGFRHAEAIAAGRTEISAMGEAGNFNVELSEDPGLFTDAGLREFEVVVFLNTDGEGILSPAQRNAFERWTQRGGGIVSIHADANADRNWAWKGDMMGGAWFLNHPAGDLQFQTATVNRVDDTHPATVDVPENWVREDEWYNFTAEPQDVHVLLELDESTYVEQDGSDGVDDDHPISWCSNYDGGRHFYTALGHHGAYWQEQDYKDHIRGAIEWASGEAEGDCGPEREGLPTDASFDKVTLDDNTENPMEIAVAGNGDVFYVELAGAVKHYDRGHRRGPQDRHDPGPPRQRERPARDHARPGLRHQPVAVPVLQPAVARDPARVALHGGGRRDARHDVGAAAARVPPPADHLLPLRRLDDLRARRQPLHLDRRRLPARRVAGLQPDRRPAGQRAGRQPGRRPRA